MRLVKVTFRGFRRFESTVAYLDRKVVALVGPNEAGKTSVLDALASLESSDAFPSQDVTRGLDLDEDVAIVEARYELAADDRALASQVGGSGEPRWFVISKLRNGEVTHRVEPPLTRPSLNYRKKAVERFHRALTRSDLEALLRRAVTGRKRKGAERMPLGQRLAKLVDALEVDDEILSEQGVDAIDFSADGIAGLLETTQDKAETEVLTALEQDIIAIKDRETSPHPEEVLIEKLEAKRPIFRKFHPQDRMLNSEYDHKILSNPPGALRNLLDLARIDPTRLATAYSEQNHGERHSLEHQANQELVAKFTQSWGQSQVTVEMQFDDTSVRVHVKTAKTYRPIAERSDGLRMFVALLAFTHNAQDPVPPILLIDEAEAHLHYDAQADLIRVFYGNEVASQIIYSTHSAGCLPSDLGTDIRLIEPKFTEDGIETDRSRIRSDFWSRGAGFSPLMLAMGASVFALSPCRFAVIAEGQSDTVLLPTLLREATQLDPLDFQVAPGLASVARHDVEQLSLEAPRVAYFLDGDRAGRTKAQLLRQAEVEDKYVVTLPRGTVLEDLLFKRVYVRAINLELSLSHGSSCRVTTTDLPRKKRPAELDVWCEHHGIDPPSKVRVAQRLVDGRPTEGMLTSSGSETLRKVYKKLLRALELE